MQQVQTCCVSPGNTLRTASILAVLRSAHSCCVSSRGCSNASVFCDVRSGPTLFLSTPGFDQLPNTWADYCHESCQMKSWGRSHQSLSVLPEGIKGVAVQAGERNEKRKNVGQVCYLRKTQNQCYN